MAQDTAAPMLLRVAELLSSLRARFSARAPKAAPGRTGTCHLCGENRDDLDESDLCTPCMMMVW